MGVFWSQHIGQKLEWMSVREIYHPDTPVVEDCHKLIHSVVDGQVGVRMTHDQRLEVHQSEQSSLRLDVTSPSHEQRALRKQRKGKRERRVRELVEFTPVGDQLESLANPQAILCQEPITEQFVVHD